jgi:hypothetical protein
MRVEITMERTVRIAKIFDVTEEQLEKLRFGNNIFAEEFEEDLEMEWENKEFWDDYSVNDEDGTNIVGWNF